MLQLKKEEYRGSLNNGGDNMTCTKVAVCLVSVAVGGALIVNLSNIIQSKSIPYDGQKETIVQDVYLDNENEETSIAVGGAVIVKLSDIIQNKNIQYDESKETIMRDGYPVNENGETYGTVRKDSSIEPDLQLTYKGGYVKQSDINDNVQTIEDALRHNERCKEGRKIPLYKSDGTTVIGEFYIGGN